MYLLNANSNVMIWGPWVLLSVLIVMVILLFVFIKKLKKTDQSSEQDMRTSIERMDATMQERLTSFSSSNKDIMDTLSAKIDEKLVGINAGQEKINKDIKEDLTKIKDSNDGSLKEIEKTVGEKLEENLEKSFQKNFENFQRYAKDIDSRLQSINAVSTNMEKLNMVFANVKKKGAWGEKVLVATLDDMLSKKHYKEQWRIPGTSELVDCAVILPGQEGNEIYLPIDSKFPEKPYTTLLEMNPSDDGYIEGQKSFKNALIKEAKSIKRKYIKVPHTTNFAVMYLPSEGMYAHAMDMVDVVEKIRKEEKVIIAGPSVLTALVSSFYLGFQTLEIRKSSSEIAEKLVKLKKDLGIFKEQIEKARKHISDAFGNLDEMDKRVDIIDKDLSKVDEDLLDSLGVESNNG